MFPHLQVTKIKVQEHKNVAKRQETKEMKIQFINSVKMRKSAQNVKYASNAMISIIITKGRL